MCLDSGECRLANNNVICLIVHHGFLWGHAEGCGQADAADELDQISWKTEEMSDLSVDMLIIYPKFSKCIGENDVDWVACVNKDLSYVKVDNFSSDNQGIIMLVKDPFFFFLLKGDMFLLDLRHFPVSIAFNVEDLGILGHPDILFHRPIRYTC